MGYIEKSLEVFEQLRSQQYRISIETGETFTLNFKKAHYHHLIGFQHLTDKPYLSYELKNKRSFYNALQQGNVKISDITSSKKYQHISERVEFFSKILEILSEGDCQIIIQYDPSKADSDIVARFLLYQRDGIPYKEDFKCYSLFIGYDSKIKSYYPATFLVEHSNKYTSGQKMYNCSISVDKKPEKKKKRTKEST